MICLSCSQVDSGLGEGYVALKQAKREMMKGWREVNITDREDHVMYDAQVSKINVSFQFITVSCR